MYGNVQLVYFIFPGVQYSTGQGIIAECQIIVLHIRLVFVCIYVCMYIHPSQFYSGPARTSDPGATHPARIRGRFHFGNETADELDVLEGPVQCSQRLASVRKLRMQPNRKSTPNPATELLTSVWDFKHGSLPNQCPWSLQVSGVLVCIEYAWKI